MWDKIAPYEEPVEAALPTLEELTKIYRMKEKIAECEPIENPKIKFRSRLPGYFGRNRAKLRRKRVNPREAWMDMGFIIGFDAGRKVKPRVIKV